MNYSTCYNFTPWTSWTILWIPSQPLFPVTPTITQWAHKVAMVAGMEAIQGLSNADFYSPRLTDCGHCWLPNQPAAETNTESSKWHHFLGWSDSYQMAIDYIRLFPSQKEQSFVFMKIDTLDIDLPFLYTMLLPQTTTYRLTWSHLWIQRTYPPSLYSTWHDF